MNIEDIKREIGEHLGKKVIIRTYGLRNKRGIYEGIVCKCFPFIFTILYKGEQKSFTYADVITKEVSIEYK